MPNTGPSDGSRTQIAARLPRRFSASPRPTVVVVLPSPAGVGVIAVTRISLPSGRPLRPAIASSDSFALNGPKASRCSSAMPSLLPATREMPSSLACCAIAMSDAILLPLLDEDLRWAVARAGSRRPEGPGKGRGEAAAAAKGRAMITCAAPPGEWPLRTTRTTRHGLTALLERDTFALIGMKKREVGRRPVGGGFGDQRRSAGDRPGPNPRACSPDAAGRGSR